ncbi:MAG: hypothetical protein H7061_12055 [Bdellovibrionaceae bacterium]|nr:hypothetical protein [Bdellovibrio sp.]
MPDPNYTGSLSNIQAGQDLLSVSFGKLNGVPYILEPSPDRTSFNFSNCNATWSINTTTSAITRVTTTTYGQANGFLNRSGKYYYLITGTWSAFTSAGHLVTQPNKNRILRIAP